MVPLERQSEFDSEGSAEFSVVMRLYPGSYEYKFVVDGNWLAGACARSTSPPRGAFARERGD